MGEQFGVGEKRSSKKVTLARLTKQGKARPWKGQPGMCNTSIRMNREVLKVGTLHSITFTLANIKGTLRSPHTKVTRLHDVSETKHKNQHYARAQQYTMSAESCCFQANGVSLNMR